MNGIELAAADALTFAPDRLDVGELLDFAPWSLLQRAIVFFTALAITFDGMDIQMMGFAIPAMSREWGVPRGSFGPILAFGLIGVACGTAIGGLLGDRIGRKKMLLGSMLVLGAATGSIVFAHTLTTLLILRLIAGAGIGGVLPNATTIAAEFTPRSRRALAVSLAIVCIPLGGVLAGLISAQVLTRGNWRALFWVGGLSPIVLAALLVFVLPESPRYLARDPRRHGELAALLRRMGISSPEKAVFYERAERKLGGEGVKEALFGRGNLRNTIAIWAAFFCCLVTVYLVFNWLPSILTGRGLGIKVASQGLAAYNFGGIFGAVAFAWWITRAGSRVPLLLGSALGLLTAWALRELPIFPGGSHGLLITALLLHGIFVNAVQTTMYALAAHLYTTEVRATGVAASLAMGRGGAILSAFLGTSILRFGSTVYFTLLMIGMGGVFLALFILQRHIEPPSERLHAV